MTFRYLELNTWRQFQHVKLDFHDNLTILTGANGSGKTTILNILGYHYNWHVNFVSTPQRDKVTGIIRYLSIEHIKPKSQFDTHIFEWENLTLACGECNRRKNDNYDENLEIINPYKVDPANYLIAYGPLIFPRPGDDAGKLTYELLELNRVGLIERRKDRLELLQLILDDYASEKNELLKKLYKRKIDKHLESSNEYLMVTKAFVETAMKQLKKRRK